VSCHSLRNKIYLAKKLTCPVHVLVHVLVLGFFVYVYEYVNEYGYGYGNVNVYETREGGIFQSSKPLPRTCSRSRTNGDLWNLIMKNWMSIA